MSQPIPDAPASRVNPHTYAIADHMIDCLPPIDDFLPDGSLEAAGFVLFADDVDGFCFVGAFEALEDAEQSSFLAASPRRPSAIIDLWAPPHECIAPLECYATVANTGLDPRVYEFIEPAEYDYVLSTTLLPN